MKKYERQQIIDVTITVLSNQRSKLSTKNQTQPLFTVDKKSKSVTRENKSSLAKRKRNKSKKNNNKRFLQHKND